MVTMTSALSSRRRNGPQPTKSTEKMLAQRTVTPTAAPTVPDKIQSNLYLSDLPTARYVMLPNYPSPGRPAIKYVLSVLDCSLSQPKPKAVNAVNFVQELIILDDTPETDLLATLNHACDWLDACLSANDGAVLVHCQLGQSRSASIVLAYLMRSRNLDFDAAITWVKSKRPSVRPNRGFVQQLKLWADLEYNIMEPVASANEPMASTFQDESESTTKELQPKQGYRQWREMQRRKVLGIDA